MSIRKCEWIRHHVLAERGGSTDVNKGEQMTRTNRTDRRTNRDRTGLTTFGPVLGLGFLANSVRSGPDRPKNRKNLSKSCLFWTRPTEDRTGPNWTGPDRSYSVSIPVFTLIRCSVLSVRSQTNAHPYCISQMICEYEGEKWCISKIEYVNGVDLFVGVKNNKLL